jgi:hypothetical protein
VPLLLADAEQASRETRHATETRLTIPLGGVDYDLVLTDEQAKLNANQLLSRMSTSEAQEAIQRVLRAARIPAVNSVRLRPRVATSAGSGLPVIGAYGQILEAESPAALLGGQDSAGVAAALTCWGDGRLNIRRAPAAAIHDMCSPILARSEIAILVRLRDENPAQSVAQLLNRAVGIDERSRTAVAALLTDETRCFGMWIIARGTNALHTFTVAEGIPPPQHEIVDPSKPYSIVRRQDFIW